MILHFPPFDQTERLPCDFLAVVVDAVGIEAFDLAQAGGIGRTATAEDESAEEAETGNAGSWEKVQEKSEPGPSGLCTGGP